MSEQHSEKKVEMKKETSYTYWVDEKNKSRDLPPEQQPKKIQAPMMIKNESESSPWNSVGTWEEKKIFPSNLKKKIENQVGLWCQAHGNQYTLSSTELDGEINLVFKRGKKNIMYDLNGMLEFERQEKKGKLKIQELTDHGDKQYRVKGDENIREWISKNIETFFKIIEIQINKYKE